MWETQETWVNGIIYCKFQICNAFAKTGENTYMRVLIASVGKPEVSSWQEEIKLQVADFFFSFLF